MFLNVTEVHFCARGGIRPFCPLRGGCVSDTADLPSQEDMLSHFIDLLQSLWALLVSTHEKLRHEEPSERPGSLFK